MEHNQSSLIMHARFQMKMHFKFTLKLFSLCVLFCFVFLI